MPTYEYLCECGEEFEEFQSISSEPKASCPVCGKPARRQISAGVGLIFKGSGFYITDYKNKSGAPASSNGSKESKGESTAPSAKTDSTASGASGGSSSGSGDSSAKPSSTTDKGAKSKSAA